MYDPKWDVYWDINKLAEKVAGQLELDVNVVKQVITRTFSNIKIRIKSDEPVLIENFGEFNLGCQNQPNDALYCKLKGISYKNAYRNNRAFPDYWQFPRFFPTPDWKIINEFP